MDYKNYVIYRVNAGYLCDYEKITEEGQRPSVRWNTRKSPKLLTMEQANNWIKMLNKYTNGTYLMVKRERRMDKREMIKAA